MTIFRRFIVLLLQVALLSLPLSGARADCAGDEHHDRGPDAAAQCDDMLACAPVALAAREVVPATHDLSAARDEFACPRELVSVTRAPDPPPPRA